VVAKADIGVIDGNASQVHADRVVPALHLGKPDGRLDRLELALDVDLLQLVNQDDSRIAVVGEVQLNDGLWHSFSLARSRNVGRAPKAAELQGLTAQ